MVGNDARGHQASADIILQRPGELRVEGAPLAEGDQLVGHIPREHLHIEPPQCWPRCAVVVLGAQGTLLRLNSTASLPEGIVHTTWWSPWVMSPLRIAALALCRGKHQSACAYNT